MLCWSTAWCLETDQVILCTYFCQNSYWVRKSCIYSDFYYCSFLFHRLRNGRREKRL